MHYLTHLNQDFCVLWASEGWGFALGIKTQGLIIGEVYTQAVEKGGHMARDSTGFWWVVSKKEDKKAKKFD